MDINAIYLMKQELERRKVINPNDVVQLHLENMARISVLKNI